MDDDQRLVTALYMSLRESPGLLREEKSEQELFWTAFWLFKRMKKHYIGNAPHTWTREGHNP